MFFLVNRVVRDPTPPLFMLTNWKDEIGESNW